MRKVLIILLCLTAIASGYFEISNDVPTVFSASGEEQWRLWAGPTRAAALFNDSSGILFNDSIESLIVGKFTPGTQQTATTAVGFFAGKENTGTGQSVFGRRAGWFNRGAGQVALGNFSGAYNTGVSHTAGGFQAGSLNTGDGQTVFGNNAGINNDGDNNTVLGSLAFNAFPEDTGSAKAIASVDFANNRVTITAGGGHGFGANGTFLNLKATTTGTLPAGLDAGPDIWRIISSTVLEAFSVSFTDGGSGTHTLTPQTVFTNSTAIGFNSEPDASNQIMLGDTNITEVKTTGSLTAPSATFDSLSIDNSGGTDAVITMDGTSDTPGTFTYESDNALFIFDKAVQASDNLTVLGNTTLGNAAGDTLNIQGVTRIGDGGTTDYIEIEADGDHVYVNGSGLPFGAMYSFQSAITVTVSSGNEWEEITSGLSGGPEHNCTFQGAHEILVTYEGFYHITWSMSVQTNAANQEVMGAVTINSADANTAIGSSSTCAQQSANHGTIVAGNKSISLGGSVYCDLAATDVVSLVVLNETTANNITVEHVTCTILQVGGT